MAKAAVRVWMAVLLVLGLVVGLLGVVPRDAVGTHGDDADVDYEALYLACVAPATESAGFEDTVGSFAEDDINCLGHYGITQGRTATSFAPAESVLRWQMALFLARAASAAGIVLESPASDQGFTDIGAVSDEAQNAINGLAKAGIMAGTSQTAFSPNTAVNRGSMAVILDAFLGAARPGAGAFASEIDAYSEVKTDSTAVFNDVNQVALTTYNAIFRIYEVGVTQGIGDHQYGPERNVTRAQMAAFIMRTLAHTVARPAGVSVQAEKTSVLGADTVDLVVSVRDSNFQAMPDAPIDAFFSTNPDEAFKDDGTCDTANVDKVGAVGNTACQVDNGDELTDGNGDLGGLSATITDADVTLWAWTGDVNDNFDNDDTTAAQLTIRFAKAANQTLVTDSLADGQTTAKFGETVTVTLQIADEDDVPVADKGKTVSVRHDTMAADESRTSGSSTYTFDADGKIVLEYTLTDSNTNTTGQSGTVMLTLSGAPTGLPLQSEDGEDFGEAHATIDGGRTMTYRWSDESPVPAALQLSANTGEFQAASDEGSGVRNSITATLTDQFGDPIRGKIIRFTSSGTSCVTDPEAEQACTPPGLGTAGVTRGTGRDGRATIGYDYDSDASAVEVITATYPLTNAEKMRGMCLDSVDDCSETDDLPDVTVTGDDRLKYYWVEDAGEAAFTGDILVKDPDNDQLVVQLENRDGTLQVFLIKYDANDQFYDFEGEAIVLSDFEKPLAEGADPAAGRLNVLSYQDEADKVSRFRLFEETPSFASLTRRAGWTVIERPFGEVPIGQQGYPGALEDWYDHRPFAVDNGVVVVGTPFETHDNGTADIATDDLPLAGKVYIYPNGTATDASDRVTLSPPVPLARGYFGWDVDISDNVIVVGSAKISDHPGLKIGNNQVYVYEKPMNGAWPTSPTATFTSSPTQTTGTYSEDVNGEPNGTDGSTGIASRDRGFGEGVAISDDGSTIALVAPGSNGGVLVYEKSGNEWTDDTDSNDNAFLRAKGGDGNGWNNARSVAISANGDVIASAGCHYDSGTNTQLCRGRLHIYERSGNSWGTGIFNPGSEADGDATARIHVDFLRQEFARYVAVSDDGSVVVVSGHNHISARKEGIAFVYVKPATGGWRAADVDQGSATYRQAVANSGTGLPDNNVVKQLTPTTGIAGDLFGYYVDIKGDGSEIAISHSRQPFPTGEGSVLTFTRPAGGWATDDSPDGTHNGFYEHHNLGGAGVTYDKSGDDLWSSGYNYINRQVGHSPIWQITGNS